MIEEILM